ncbi:protein SICKLE [Capsella rubella]|uniref:protein SICKLE n=1 Tax=Capsella rubella TaxID=81985 RepID=UPI000CD52253|nr:protein SICKLE [Capsella rubella]XP_023634677.1 protein SICKLE [Capsella rubella]
MEDSEKRKQMLKAMRMEAAAQNDDGSTGLETSGDTAHLSNPLAETSTHQQDSCETPRFDYYTDPMSAYSSFKRNKTPKQQYVSSPHHQTSSPVPPPQFPPSVPGSLGSEYQAHTNHGGFQASHYDGNNLHTGPRGMGHLSPSHRGSPVAWNNNYRPPPVNHLGPPQWVPRPFPFSQEIPDMGNNRFGGRGSYNNTAPQFSHYGRQNSNWVGNTYPNSGRGRSRGRGMNTSFGRDGGRRPMELGAERFYSNSMAEDPWKYLKPVLWKGCSDACSSNSTSQSWLPNSIAPKKSVNSEASHKASNNQQSLAEYLAASLDEATGDESSN